MPDPIVISQDQRLLINLAMQNAFALLFNSIVEMTPEQVTESIEKEKEKRGALMEELRSH